MRADCGGLICTFNTKRTVTWPLATSRDGAVVTHLGGHPVGADSARRIDMAGLAGKFGAEFRLFNFFL